MTLPLYLKQIYKISET